MTIRNVPGQPTAGHRRSRRPVLLSGLGVPPGTCHRFRWLGCVGLTLALVLLWAIAPARSAELEVGFAHVDITPQLNESEPVWLAGYYPGRAATGVHDPLCARSLVLRSGETLMAWVSVDLIGVQYPLVQQLRGRLSEYDYVLVASTHNHEGPDVIGVWGETYLQRGVHEPYLDLLVSRMEEAVRKAEKELRPAVAAFGTANDPSLLEDKRLPVVKDGVLRALHFTQPDSGKSVGMVVQWNCHPEALGPDNTLITADFPATTVSVLEQHYQCPVVYFTGALGGLLAPPERTVRNALGEEVVLREGDFALAKKYGEDVAALAKQAVSQSRRLNLTPIQVASQTVAVPTTNPLYRWARLLGIIRRDTYAWKGAETDFARPLTSPTTGETPAIASEVACIRLGDLRILCVPGELYPELVVGKIDDPARAGADYPDAAKEPHANEIVPDGTWMLFGLANDEVGYLMPQRHWDQVSPFIYDPSGPQYGEINSCDPRAASVIMSALREQVNATRQVPRP